VAFLDQPPTPRAALTRRKDVRRPTGAGLLVRGPGRARLLRAAELDGTYIEQSDCVVSDDATHIACVRRAGRGGGLGRPVSYLATEAGELDLDASKGSARTRASVPPGAEERPALPLESVRLQRARERIDEPR